MQIAKRVFLFVTVNILVMISLSVIYSILAGMFGLPMEGNVGLIFFCVLFGFGGAFISLLISKWSAIRMMGVQVIDPRTPDHTARALVEKVHGFARAAGLPKMPDVGIYNSPEVNAFATGPSKSNSLVAVSTGLLEKMNDEEVSGVLAHEVAHIANGDMVTMTLLQGIINAVVLLAARLIANVVVSQMSKDDDRPGFFMHHMIVMAIEIPLSFLGAMVVMAFSRRREFRADAGGAKFAGRERMIASLRKLQRSTELVDKSQEAIMTFKISSGRRSKLAMLFSSHPPLEDRIRALERAHIL